MIINDLDGYYIVFDTKNWNTELDTLISIYPCSTISIYPCSVISTYRAKIATNIDIQEDTL